MGRPGVSRSPFRTSAPRICRSPASSPRSAAGSAGQQNPFVVSNAGPVGVAPGGQLVLDVAFVPAVNEAAIGSLTISSDDLENPEITIGLSGRGGAGQLVVQPDALELENTTVGRSRAVEIVVRNLGTTAIEGARLTTDGFVRPEHFRLTGLVDFATPAPFALDARGRQVLLLTYEPQEVGADDGIIRGRDLRRSLWPGDSGHRIRERRGGSALSAGARTLAAWASGSRRVRFSKLKTWVRRPPRSGPLPRPAMRRFRSKFPSGDLPITLQPQERLGLTVTFAPTEAGRARGAVVVTTNLGSVPELQAGLTGQGEGPLFVVTPASVDFGTERGPGVYQRAVVLNNAGSSEVQVSSVGLAGTDTLTLGPTPGLTIRWGRGSR